MSKHNCRFCNHDLPEGARKCPSCKRGQTAYVDYLALFTIGCVLILVGYMLFKPESEPEPYKIEKTTVVIDQPTVVIRKKTVPSPRTYFAKPKTQTPTSKTTKTSIETVKPWKVTPKPVETEQYQDTKFLQELGDFPYYVAERRWNSQTKSFDFFRKGMHGAEPTDSRDIRRYMISEHQNNYPTPQSGCGPTALLNLYVWYSKFGLIQEKIRHSNPKRYKQLKFREIDRKISEIKGQARSPYGGTNTLEQVIAIDEIVQDNSKNPLRVHFEYTEPPLKTSDFLNITRNFRSGILSVQPKDSRTGRMMGNHAVLVIRGDTAGKITVSNWGEFQHGRLVNKPDGQWFIPDDTTQHSLKINKLTTLIPFVPKA
ncbi:hypothetical protein [Rubellicoccus peritrichatus]|uniref:Uncharacterized protein n=1 Tax=Rubellicoccus peritrichatus TaxID=3080537 RepID=A0AAQ3QUF7_9BACT|nr:hypothetical protein [Puniceicoccus sp. CR14]WOO39662.1 hypothetical protein RZN69_13645 [Puniceicoccus sp. CR14]